MRILSLFKGLDKWQNLNKALAHSFNRIKSETSLIFSWLHYFREKDKVHDERHYHVQQQLQHHDRQIDRLKEEVFGLKSELLQLKIGQKVGSFPNLVRTKSEPEGRTAFERNILAKIRHQRKAYVMDQIMKLIEKGIHSTKEIETTIVKEKALCGRTAFYDYLRELKHKNLIKYEEKGIKRIVTIA